ncbi:MAG TPA: M14 family metallocarboxypeptidase, partial [Lacunisphaera sp.]|nr:M14 family metallocarboxypeptidase [Lacunisphaera sp.]
TIVALDQVSWSNGGSGGGGFTSRTICTHWSARPKRASTLSSHPPAFPLDPRDFSPRFDEAARSAGFRSTTLGEISGHRMAAYTKRSPGRRPRIYLSAGMHGDEPAPPWALLRLLQENFFDARCTWFVCPLLNPTGFVRQTRENAAGLDLNRDYKAPQTAEIQAHVSWLQLQPNFDLAVCLHEDWEATGFYLYELNPCHRPTLANVMIDAARAHVGIESGAVIDGRDSFEPGIIRPVSDPLLRETWPEAIYLRHHHCSLDYTTETPSRLPLEQRVVVHCAAIRAAVDSFRR